MIDAEEFANRAKRIKLLVLDVDGVLTGGQIILDNEGNELKMFHVRDGHGIKMAQRAGIETAIITGRGSRAVEHRAAELGIEHVYQKSFDKLKTFEELVVKTGIGMEEVAFVGDDIVDIPVMRRAGLAFAVADAEDYVKEAAHMVTGRKGGEGAVREVIDGILKAGGGWESVSAKYYV